MGRGLGRRLEALSPHQAAWMVAVVGALVYANSLWNGFAYDDVSIIVENETIQSWERLRSAVFAPYWPIVGGAELALWRPVTTGLFGLQYLLADGSPVPFHVVNVLVHAAASGVLVLLLAHLTSMTAAWVAGMVFAVHPVHTEAVANVVGQAEVVAGLAALLALLVHIRGGGRSGWGTALGVGALYVVGFGAKESAVTLLGLVFLVDAARERLGFREASGLPGATLAGLLRHAGRGRGHAGREGRRPRWAVHPAGGGRFPAAPGDPQDLDPRRGLDALRPTLGVPAGPVLGLHTQRHPRVAGLERHQRHRRHPGVGHSRRDLGSVAEAASGARREVGEAGGIRGPLVPGVHLTHLQHALPHRRHARRAYALPSVRRIGRRLWDGWWFGSPETVHVWRRPSSCSSSLPGRCGPGSGTRSGRATTPCSP